MKSIVTSAVISAAIVGSLACVHGMATAHADTDSYIWRLENNDLVDFYGSKALFVEAGYRVCADLSVGWSDRTIIDALYYNLSYNFTYTAAEEVFYLAAEELC